jgi:DNA-directed RNA polymerase specialized sigma24 family protein
VQARERRAKERSGGHRYDATSSDDVMLTRVRDGDQDAVAELYERHHAAARSYARHLSLRYLRHDAGDDVVSEAVRKLLEALAAGKGPTTGFRPYLFACVRSVVYARARREAGRDEVTHDHPTVAGPDVHVDSWLARSAFGSLPRPTQRLLWSTSVLGFGPTDLAATAGVTPNNLGVMANRARDRLRAAYVRAFLPPGRTDTCAAVLDAVARHAARPVTDRQAATIGAHLDRCEPCRLATDRLREEMVGTMFAVAPTFPRN